MLIITGDEGELCSESRGLGVHTFAFFDPTNQDIDIKKCASKFSECSKTLLGKFPVLIISFT